MMKFWDFPPVWLIGFLGLAWLLPWPAGWTGWTLPGTVLFWLGIVLIVLAALEFLRAKTTIVPRQAPKALIDGGVFRFSRNPIYLADVLILAGCALGWGSVIGLILVPVLIWVLRVRFIEGEEARLEAEFGDAYRAYKARTRRWI